MNSGSSMQNGLINPVILTFDLLTPKTYHFEYIPRSFAAQSLNTLGSFVFELGYEAMETQLGTSCFSVTHNYEFLDTPPTD